MRTQKERWRENNHHPKQLYSDTDSKNGCLTLCTDDVTVTQMMSRYRWCHGLVFFPQMMSRLRSRSTWLWPDEHSPMSCTRYSHQRMTSKSVKDLANFLFFLFAHFFFWRGDKNWRIIPESYCARDAQARTYLKTTFLTSTPLSCTSNCQFVSTCTRAGAREAGQCDFGQMNNHECHALASLTGAGQWKTSSDFEKCYSKIYTFGEYIS